MNIKQHKGRMTHLQGHVECWNLYAEDELNVMNDASEDHLPGQYFKTVGEGVSKAWPQHSPSKKNSYIGEG